MQKLSLVNGTVGLGNGMILSFQTAELIFQPIDHFEVVAEKHFDEAFAAELSISHLNKKQKTVVVKKKKQVGSTEVTSEMIVDFLNDHPGSKSGSIATALDRPPANVQKLLWYMVRKSQLVIRNDDGCYYTAKSGEKKKK